MSTLMRKPAIGKPRTAAGAFSLSRTLPKLRLPTSAASVSPTRPRPKIGKPAKSKGLEGKGK
jgi:hypothetical protein